MPGTTLEFIGGELQAKHLVKTSWQELGLIYDEAAAAEVIGLSAQDHTRPPLVEGKLPSVARANSPVIRTAARALIKPVVDRLFVGEQYADTRNKWDLFGVNYYDEGDVFEWHRDSNNPELKTIVIGSLSGLRRFAIEGYGSVDLDPESVLVLDGAANLRHKAECLEGPSTSVVADVPELLYGDPMSFNPARTS